jgi:hypothetical protein
MTAHSDRQLAGDGSAGAAATDGGRDRRRYPRFEVPARVALLGADRQWHWHDLRDASAVGVAVANRSGLALGSRVPLQIERVGGGVGRVVRAPGGAPCIDLEHGDAPAELRHRRLAWLTSDRMDQRRHQRVRPAGGAKRAILVPVEFTDGTRIEARLTDVSAGGMRLDGLPAAVPDLAVGIRLVAGGVSGSVVWSAGGAIAVAFDREVDVNRLKLSARSATG